MLQELPLLSAAVTEALARQRKHKSSSKEAKQLNRAVEVQVIKSIDMISMPPYQSWYPYQSQSVFLSNAIHSMSYQC